MLHVQENNSSQGLTSEQDLKPSTGHEDCRDSIEEAIAFRHFLDCATQSSRSTFCEKLVGVAERSVALFMLIATSPVMAAIAIAIRIDSPGPAIFTQRRIAKIDRSDSPIRGGDPEHNCHLTLDELRKQVPTFTMFKFRTYHHCSERLAPERAVFNFNAEQIGDVHLQLKDDPRITRVGRFLRRTSLDELPNFLNVLKGEMRLIGPRPEVQQMIRYYTAEQLEKFTVKPGITGLAQVNGRGRLNFSQTLGYDLWYVRNRSWHVDLKILLRTVRVVLTGEGSF